MRAAGERTYPQTAGYVSNSPTSKAGSSSIQPKLGDLRSKVLGLFEAAGARGLSDAELQAAGGTSSILRPRRIELTALGKIKDSGFTRPSPSGIEVTVWVLT